MFGGMDMAMGADMMGMGAMDMEMGGMAMMDGNGMMGMDMMAMGAMDMGLGMGMMDRGMGMDMGMGMMGRDMMMMDMGLGMGAGMGLGFCPPGCMRTCCRPIAMCPPGCMGPCCVNKQVIVRNVPVNQYNNNNGFVQLPPVRTQPYQQQMNTTRTPNYVGNDAQNQSIAS